MMTLITLLFNNDVMSKTIVYFTNTSHSAFPKKNGNLFLEINGNGFKWRWYTALLDVQYILSFLCFERISDYVLENDWYHIAVERKEDVVYLTL